MMESKHCRLEGNRKYESLTEATNTNIFIIFLLWFISLMVQPIK